MKLWSTIIAFSVFLLVFTWRQPFAQGAVWREHQRQKLASGPGSNATFKRYDVVITLEEDQKPLDQSTFQTEEIPQIDSPLLITEDNEDGKSQPESAEDSTRLSLLSGKVPGEKVPPRVPQIGQGSTPQIGQGSAPQIGSHTPSFSTFEKPKEPITPNQVAQEVQEPLLSAISGVGWNANNVPLVMENLLAHTASGVASSAHSEELNLYGSPEAPAMASILFSSDATHAQVANTVQQALDNIGTQSSGGYVGGGSSQTYGMALTGEYTDVTVTGSSDSHAISNVEQLSYSNSAEMAEVPTEVYNSALGLPLTDDAILSSVNADEGQEAEDIILMQTELEYPAENMESAEVSHPEEAVVSENAPDTANEVEILMNQPIEPPMIEESPSILSASPEIEAVVSVPEELEPQEPIQNEIQLPEVVEAEPENVAEPQDFIPEMTILQIESPLAEETEESQNVQLEESNPAVETSEDETLLALEEPTSNQITEDTPYEAESMPNESEVENDKEMEMLSEQEEPQTQIENPLEVDAFGEGDDSFLFAYQVDSPPASDDPTDQGEQFSIELLPNEPQKQPEFNLQEVAPSSVEVDEHPGMEILHEDHESESQSQLESSILEDEKLQESDQTIENETNDLSPIDTSEIDDAPAKLNEVNSQLEDAAIIEEIIEAALNDAAAMSESNKDDVPPPVMVLIPNPHANSEESLIEAIEEALDAAEEVVAEQAFEDFGSSDDDAKNNNEELVEADSSGSKTPEENQPIEIISIETVVMPIENAEFSNDTPKQESETKIGLHSAVMQ